MHELNKIAYWQFKEIAFVKVNGFSKYLYIGEALLLDFIFIVF